jgi:hypothetical protein
LLLANAIVYRLKRMEEKYYGSAAFGDLDMHVLYCTETSFGGICFRTPGPDRVGLGTDAEIMALLTGVLSCLNKKSKLIVCMGLLI